MNNENKEMKENLKEIFSEVKVVSGCDLQIFEGENSHILIIIIIIRVKIEVVRNIFQEISNSIEQFKKMNNGMYKDITIDVEISLKNIKNK